MDDAVLLAVWHNRRPAAVGESIGVLAGKETSPEALRRAGRLAGLAEVWSEILSPDQQVGVEPMGLHGSVLTVKAPNTSVRYLLERTYAARMLEAVRQRVPEVRKIRFALASRWN